MPQTHHTHSHRPVHTHRVHHHHASTTTAANDGSLRERARGPAVTDLQRALVARGHPIDVDGIFGPQTTQAVNAFQQARGLTVDGVVGKDTKAALKAPTTTRDHVDATVPGSGVRAPTPAELAQRPSGTVRAGSLQTPTTRGVPSGRPASTSSTPSSTATSAGAAHRSVTVDGHTFQVHNQTRAQMGRHSVPGHRFISLDANSSSGHEEILRPQIVIPNNATAAERAAARAAVDGVARWLSENAPGRRATTGIVTTTAQNGRGIGGFFHTEFFSVNDSGATALIKNKASEYAHLLGQTLGTIPGANFIVPHGMVRGGHLDTGAVSADGRTSERSLGQTIVNDGFGRL
jgi:peptidoglycan hydrolase-like protein with peptidoglycan-binding domain